MSVNSSQRERYAKPYATSLSQCVYLSIKGGGRGRGREGGRVNLGFLCNGAVCGLLGHHQLRVEPDVNESGCTLNDL